MKKMLVLVAMFACLIPAVYLGIRLHDYAQEREAPQESISAPSAREETEAAPEQAPPPARVTLVAAGDDLIHDSLYNQAYARTGGQGYDFRPLYTRVADRIQDADVAFINQETMMAASRPPSTYPAFNTPTDLAPQLAELGFDVVNLANNHMLDLGASGLLETVDLVDSIPQFTRIGVYRGPEEKEITALLEKNGITFAFVGFAEYTNAGGTKGAPDMTVYTNERDTIARQLAAARALADVVVVSVHFGTENTTVPNPQQVDTVHLFSDLGADIVIGHHPHVVQPVEVLQNESGRRTLVFYSLGNFVSAQSAPSNLVGLMPEITVEKDPQSGEITVLPPIVHAIVTHYGNGMAGVQIYPLEQYTQELAGAHGVRSREGGGAFSLEFIHRLLADTISAEYLPGPEL